jgi:membrane-associated HD superfamily phosphohydrolase
MKSDNNRKYLLIFSGILLGFQYLGLVVDGNIPFTQIKISSQANIPIILTILIFFFGGQFTFYWLKQEKEERSFFEFITAIPVALVAIVPVIYSYLKKFGIDWKVIASTILILLLGSLLAIAVDFIISIIFSLRTPEEMKKMGLGKIPSASKAFIRSLYFFIPLNGGA